MNKLKTFYYSFIKSISTPSYYRDIVKAPLSFSFKYVLLVGYFLILLQVLISAIAIARELPKLPQFTQMAKQRLDTLYPKDLVVTIKDGTLSTNKKEPFYIDVPELQDEKIKHTITVDTKAQAEDYFDYDTFVLVTDDVVIYPEESASKKGYTVTPIEEMEKNVSFNRSDYNEFLAVANTALDKLPSIVPFLLIGGVLVLPFIFAGFMFVRNIIIVAILSVITLLIALSLKLNLPYKKVFQMGLHAATIPMLLMTFLFFFNVSMPLLFVSSFLLWMAIILSQYKEVKE